VVGQSGQSKTVEGLLERGGGTYYDDKRPHDGWMAKASCVYGLILASTSSSR